jgi:adenylyltransferase/sulfurtransferase
MQEITVTELKKLMDEVADIQLIDVREPNEYAFAKIEGAKHIPLGELLQRMSEIDETKDTIVHCRSGVRSANAIHALQNAGFQGNLTNLKGGILAWSDEVDPSVPKY